MKILSLYSGGGGIDIGFGKNNFKTVLSIENWDKACLTLKKNNISKNVICEDIRKVDFNNIKNQFKFDCIVGGHLVLHFSKSNSILEIKKEHLRMMILIHLQITFWLLKNLNPKYFFLKMYMVLF